MIMKKLLIICITMFPFLGNVYTQNTQPGHTSNEVFAEDGAWCWFSDPRAVAYDGKHNRTYLGFVTSTGDITISYYDHKTGDIGKKVIYPELQIDDHVNPSLLFLPDGRLMAFFTRHNGGFYYSTTLEPEDISNWEEVSYIDMGPRLCYTNPVLLEGENNRIYVFLRGGYEWKPVYIYSNDYGKNWSDPQKLVSHIGVSSQNRPYTKVKSDGKSKIWFAITDGHPRDEPLNSIYVFYYEEGSYYQVDGRKIATIKDLPINQNVIDKAYDGVETKVRSWIWDLALDEDGKPRIAYTRLKEETQHHYYYASWNGTSWEHTMVASGGQDFPREERLKEERNREPHYSGGIVLDPNHEGVVYYSRPVNDRYEIFRGEFIENKWEETPITQNSSLDNVRPYVSDSKSEERLPRLFWMTNRMYEHYSNYDTFIQMQTQK